MSRNTVSIKPTSLSKVVMSLLTKFAFFICVLIILEPFDLNADTPPEFLLKWGEYGTGDGQFKTPSGIAVDSSGDVYVADTWNGRIQKFTRDGKFLWRLGTLLIHGSRGYPALKRQIQIN